MSQIANYLDNRGQYGNVYKNMCLFWYVASVSVLKAPPVASWRTGFAVFTDTNILYILLCFILFGV
jgi:hypothetical protein